MVDPTIVGSRSKKLEKISAVYKVVNTVTGDFYIGSSVDVKRRWSEHKRTSKWNERPNSMLYKAMKGYGIDKFSFQILAMVEPEYLKQVEQEFIDMLKPEYNNNNAKGFNVEREKERHKSSKYKMIKKEYQKTDKGKEVLRKGWKKYMNKMCFYNGETLTLNALRCRFYRAGIEHSFSEAIKYLIE